jgi:hypothetical protein
LHDLSEHSTLSKSEALALAGTIKDGEEFILLAYVGTNGFVQQRVNWQDLTDIVDIWRRHPEEARFAVVRRKSRRHGIIAVDMVNVGSWFSDGTRSKQFNCRQFKNLDQAIMACAMQAG